MKTSCIPPIGKNISAHHIPQSSVVTTKPREQFCDPRSKTVLKLLHKPNIVKSKGVYINAVLKRSQRATKKLKTTTTKKKTADKQIR